MDSSQRILIKGMLCHRCIEIVRTELLAIGVKIENVSLGEVAVSAATAIDRRQIQDKLGPWGFSLVEDKVSSIVELVKELVNKVYSGDFDFPEKFRFSQLVNTTFFKDYDWVSSVFSAAEGQTLEKYIIDFRINKVKEFLVYTEDTLSAISFRLGFNSVAHLSRQFKQHTGLNPSHFKEIRKTRATII